MTRKYLKHVPVRDRRKKSHFRVKFTDPVLGPEHDYVVLYQTEQEAQMIVDKTNHARNARVLENLIALQTLQSNGSASFNLDDTASKTAGLYAMYIGVEMKKLDTPKTHCRYGHKFTEANTYRSPSRPAYRLCKICMEKRIRARNGSGHFR
jgi:hypothetical protein